MSAPKHIYLGNILGATGPVGPAGPAGQSAIGCNNCHFFYTSLFRYLEGTNTLMIDFGPPNFQSSCWTVGELVTITGKDMFGVDISEQAVISSINEVSRFLTIDNLTKFFHWTYSITMCHGGNIGPTGPSGGPMGATGPIGPSGNQGEDCRGCFGVSTTNLDLNNPLTVIGENATITIAEGLPCLEGARIRVHDRTLDSTSFLEGTIYSYENNQLTFTIDYKNGNSNSSSWNFGIAGIVGATGPIGLVGPEMNLNAEDKQIIFNNLGEAKGAKVFYETTFNISGEEVNMLGVLTSAPEETLDINGSLKIRLVEPIGWPYN